MGADQRPIHRTAKKNERDAELAFWYGVDPSHWPESRKIGYLANLNRVKSQDIIHQGLYDPTDYRGVFRLYLAAYGDIELARQAQGRAMERYVEQKCQQPQH